MRIVIRCVLASLAATLLGACASTPKSTMLVPSRTTVPELEKLRHQMGTTVDVLTVHREERRLLLDGAGGNALAGQDLNASSVTVGSEAVATIPFDELALIYYSHGQAPDKDRYPSLPGVGAAEKTLGCDELDTEIGRAGAIRWYARRQGAAPFTAHEAEMQHGKNALKGVGEVVLVAVMIAGCSGGSCTGFGGGSSPPSDPVSMQNYRWAVTAADGRIIGLLELKRERACAAQKIRMESETDLGILSQIEESRQALATNSTSDRDQRDLQTRLLDQFDPPRSSTDQAEFASAILTHSETEWFPNADATQGLSKFSTGTKWHGKISLTDQELVFQPQAGADTPAATEVRISYSDLASVVVAQHVRWRGVVVTQRDGHKDSFSIVQGGWVDGEATQVAGELLKSKVATVAQ
jgi:hypothetical protein